MQVAFFSNCDCDSVTVATRFFTFLPFYPFTFFSFFPFLRTRFQFLCSL